MLSAAILTMPAIASNMRGSNGMKICSNTPNNAKSQRELGNDVIPMNLHYHDESGASLVLSSRSNAGR